MHDMTKQPQVSPRAVSAIEKSHPVPQAFCRSYAAIVALRQFPKPPHQVSKSPEKNGRTTARRIARPRISGCSLMLKRIHRSFSRTLLVLYFDCNLTAKIQYDALNGETRRIQKVPGKLGGAPSFPGTFSWWSIGDSNP